MNFITSFCRRPRSFFAAKLLLAVLSAGFAAPALPAQDIHPASNADTSGQPSLQETTAWLTTHLTGITSTYLWVRTHPEGKTNGGKKGPPPPEVSQVKESVTNASVDGCHLTLTTERDTTGQGLPVTRTSQFVIPLELMDNAYLGVTEHQPEKSSGETETFVPKTANIIHIGGPLASIAYTAHDGGKAGATSGDNDSGTYHLIELPNDDTTFTQRIVTALNHAIQLCHATLKPEPF
jgi:hypothetical protein